MQQDYKNEGTHINDLNFNDSNAPKIALPALEDLFICFRKDLENPAIEENVLSQDMLSIFDIIKRTQCLLPENILISIFQLLDSPSRLICKTATRIIEWSLSFYSILSDILLNNGLLEFIFNHFPNNNADSFAYYLMVNHSKGREILIRHGYLDKIPLLLPPIQPNPQLLLPNQLAFVNPNEKEEIINVQTLTNNYISQLIALTKHQFEEIPSEIAQTIFSLFEPLHQLFECNLIYASNIITAYYYLIRSNEIFLDPFISSNIMANFISSKCDNTNFIFKLLILMQFLCNQNDDIAHYLIEIGSIEFAIRNMKVDIDQHGQICSKSIQFITDIMFHCPETICDIYLTAVPELIADMLNDNDTTGFQKVDLLSFVIVMMTLASTEIYVEIAKDYGYYKLLAENIHSVDLQYASWAIRNLYKGFLISNEEDLIHLKTYLSENQDLISWLENLDDKDENLTEKAQLLLQAILQETG